MILNKISTAVALSFFSLILSPSAFANCPEGTSLRSERISSKPLCAVKGQYLNSSLNLNSANDYVLDGSVRMGADNSSPSVITIEAGTTIYGAADSNLVIMRGSKIFANGTAKQPVVFTSLQRTDLRAGLWAGMVINGNAPINGCRADVPLCEAQSEGFKDNPPLFGGNRPNDNSGRLTYVRVEYAGKEISLNNELNGITFNGVGNETLVDYVQVYKGADDGVEFFGGTVNVRHLILTDNDDDGLDWDMGWSGRAQFILIELENGTEDSNGIEADNLRSPMDAQPRSNPILSNVTVLAKGSNPRLFNGILLRRGTAGQIHNAIVAGDFKVACVNIDDEETFRVGGNASGSGVEQTGLKLVNSMINCSDSSKNFEDKVGDLFKVSEWFKDKGLSRNLLADPQLTNRRPDENNHAANAGRVPRAEGSFQFTPVPFIGALSPYEDEDWTMGWSLK